MAKKDKIVWFQALRMTTDDSQGEQKISPNVAYYTPRKTKR